VETVEESQKAKGKGQSFNSKVIKLSDVEIDENRRISTGEGELDSVLGGGMVPGMVTLIAGEPGIGKSTLLTQVALNNTSNEVLYVCGEESASQVALRVKRLETLNSKSKIINLLLFEFGDVDEVVAKIGELKPKLVIVDSIQTMRTQDLTGVAGSVGQVRECTERLATSAKGLAIPMFIVGHVTKEGTIAGPRVLEHIVDTVVWFEGERGQSLRLVRTIKNRFGACDTVGVFEMTEKGLTGMSDPSKHLLAERVLGVPGSVVTVVMEGTRPLLLEIQALVTSSNLAMPRRVVTGIDLARVQMLVAVLAKHAGLHLESSDVFVNVTSGIRLADRGVDLAVCLAIASSFLNKCLAADVAAVGEVGLLGEVRKVGNLERRIREAKKLGYKVASAESGKSVAKAIKKLLE
jgi:DNA repair protein RadA/Sms